MKTFLSFILALIFFLGSCKRHAKKENFEGVILYSITFTPNSGLSDRYVQFLRSRYGDSMKLFVSHTGDFRQEFPYSDSNGFRSMLSLATKNRQFMQWRNTDTTYTTNSVTNSLEFVSEEELPGQNIKGQSCKCYAIAAVEAKGRQPVSLTYFYPADKEYINPDLHRNHNDFFYNKVIAKMKAPYYKLVMDMGKYSITLTMESIQATKVDPDIFKEPTSYPVLEKL